MQSALPAIASAATVIIAAGLFALPSALGPLSAHMLTHILMMSAVAPLLAVALSRHPADRGSVTLWIATTVQIGLLWAWHLPALQQAAGAPAVMLAMHISLLAAATWFWHALMGLSAARRWHALPALLITGKLACLLAALMIFAPRALYDMPPHAHAGTPPPLDDQQLAGLLMIVACPASYIVAAILVASQILTRLASAGPPPAVRLRD